MNKIIIITTLLMTQLTLAICQIHDTSAQKSSALNDLVAILLSKNDQCPQNVMEFKEVLNHDNLSSHPSLVANRGRNNPAHGSFSIFETVSGYSKNLMVKIDNSHLYFGHFTKQQNKVILLDQNPLKGKLLIELISWDFKKQLYNFYELIGQGDKAYWYYRGDSKDAIFDNELLKRQTSKTAKFGKRMRCSACHNSGGPIMKELHFPHNDWWTVSRKLVFSPNSPSKALTDYLENLTDASLFAKNVKMGMGKLLKSPHYQYIKANKSLKDLLKPLFCTTEVNLLSSNATYNYPASIFNVSSHNWLHPIWGDFQLTVETKPYYEALEYLNFQFPETGHRDADHLWLTPIKGYSNNLEILSLIKNQLITKEFASDVLAIDYKNPLFSKERCSLLKYLPHKADNWFHYFINNLKQSHSLSGSLLLRYIQDPKENFNAHKNTAITYLKEIQDSLHHSQGVAKQLSLLNVKRQSVFTDEISQNPLGQILEPGFRVIFPIVQK